MPTLTEPKYYKMTNLQEQILREIGRGVNLSISSLAKQIGKYRADVSGAVAILLKKGFIIQKGEKQGRGIKEKFYILTDSGIEQLVRLKITLEDFWKLVFFVFDETTGHELKEFTVDSLFHVYEKEVLMLPRDHATPLYDWAIIYFKHLKKKPERLEPAVRVLLALARDQPLSINEILSRLHISKSMHYAYYSSKPKNSAIINDLITFLLVDRVKSTSKKYRLSHFGILFLLTELFDKTSASMQVLEHLDTHEIIKLIAKNYEDLYPLIFRNWNVLSKILTEKELVGTFRMVLNYEESHFSGTPIQNGGLYELFSALKSMRRVYQDKLEKLLEAGQKTRDKWAEKNPNRAGLIHNRQSMIMLNLIQHKLEKLSLPNSIDAVLVKIVELVMETTSYDLKTARDSELLNYQLSSIYKRKNVRQTLVDLVTFSFYTLLVYQIRFRLDILQSISDIEPKAKENTSWIINNWNRLLNNNRGFAESYSKWIAAITDFESRNVEFMKKLDNFSIRSSEEQKEQNIYFARQMIRKKNQ